MEGRVYLSYVMVQSFAEDYGCGRYEGHIFLFYIMFCFAKVAGHRILLTHEKYWLVSFQVCTNMTNFLLFILILAQV